MLQLGARANSSSPPSSDSAEAGASAVANTATGRHFRSKASRFHVLLLAGILSLGILARTWEFGALPPGLNADEASSGVDAFSLYRFGTDANGNSFPVYLVSFGSGTSALFAYLVIPFIALGGLSPFTVRLPMLISAILTLPLVYLIGRRALSRDFGLIAMFLVAISPWHILLSRWALDGNLLPFVFSVAFLCLLEAVNRPIWFIPAMLFMGLGLYVYSTAYAAIPIFLACALPVLIRTGRLNTRILAFGLAVLAAVAAPIALFVVVNTLHFESLHVGAITVPRLPMQPRYETQAVIFGQHVLETIASNARELARLLWTQQDDIHWNTLYPYGYFYRYTSPIAALGAILLAKPRKHANAGGPILLLVWLFTGLVLGVLQPPNINRINLVFIPLILCVAALVLWIAAHSRVGLLVTIAGFLLAFTFFSIDYHGYTSRSVAAGDFYQGLLPAIDFAAQSETGPICISDRVNMPYVFVMFSQPRNPRYYLDHIRYSNPHAQFRQVDHLDRYSFGLDKCPNREKPTYVLMDEALPQDPANYKSSTFDRFTVFTPVQPPR